MKVAVFLFLFLCTKLALQAQQQPHQHSNGEKCWYEYAILEMEAKHPGFTQAINFAFKEAKRAGLANKHLRNNLTIPVVVHVLWNTPDQKISECKILEQIEVLNEDYNRLHSDSANLRPIFDTIVANPNITFRLDTIIWKYTTVNDFSASGNFDDAKKSSTGGSNAINTGKYLNMWFCNLGTSGTLGFAYPPAGMSNWPPGIVPADTTLQGIIIDYKVVGRSATYTATSPFGPPTVINTQGRTAVHEAGHYLGLRHIWGDGTDTVIIFGTPFVIPGPSCTADDGIMDTPNAADRSQFDCDTSKNSCDTTMAGDLPDMIENYMDYSAESCMNAFTQGQVDLMRGVLFAQRAQLSTTSDPNRPTNDGMLYPQDLLVSTTPMCLTLQAGNTQNARPSMDPCTGTVARDVWYSFTAINDSLVLELSSVVGTGSSLTLVHEVLEDACITPNSLGCSTQNSDTLTGLTPGNTYMVRVYSLDSLSSHNFDICVRNVSNTVITNTQTIAQTTPNIAIAPNPTNGLFTIQVDGTINTGFVQVRNLLGQPISNQLNLAGQKSSIQVDLGKQSSGVYILEFHIDGQQLIKKVILNK